MRQTSFRSLKSILPTLFIFCFSFGIQSCNEKEEIPQSKTPSKRESSEFANNTPTQPILETETKAPPPSPIHTPPKAPDEWGVSKGKLGIKILDKLKSDPDGLIRFIVVNRLGDTIKSARVWVFLLDESGKMISQKAKWLISSNSSSEEEFSSESFREFKILIPTQESYHEAKITFSKVTLAERGEIHPESVMEMAVKLQ